MASIERKWAPPGRLKVDLDSNWANLKGEIEGELAYIRVNEGLKAVVGHPEYDHRLIVSIQVNAVREDGMPATEEELSAIDQVEDIYRNTLQTRQESLLAAVVTTNGRRDLIFYTSNPQQAIHRFENDLQPLAETRQVDFMIHPDADWDLYQDFT
jgi:Family of unknown function (DUF695)